MGLIRTTLRLLPYAAVGILGYYLGTIKSDQYETIFDERCISETVNYTDEMNALEKNVYDQYNKG